VKKLVLFPVQLFMQFVIFASYKEVMFSSSLVCVYAKITQTIFTKNRVKAAREPWKKPLHLGVIRITLR